jgi:23S rRNA pseudouridine2604 synthase
MSESPHNIDTPTQVRLSKRMAELGLCSRREADDWIERGLVRVYEAPASLGMKVSPDLSAQHIHIAHSATGEQRNRLTIVLHKPVGYVSGQAEDGYTPAITLITPQNRWRDDDSRVQLRHDSLRGLAPAGRLDIDSTGMLILTQDGRVARQLIGEDSAVDKEYLVRVALADSPYEQASPRARFPQEQLKLLRHGLSLDGAKLKPALVEWLNDDQLRFVLREGKKRQIRRMCELVGLRAIGLKRVRMGNVRLGKLPMGAWRVLREDEGF